LSAFFASLKCELASAKAGVVCIKACCHAGIADAVCTTTNSLDSLHIGCSLLQQSRYLFTTPSRVMMGTAELDTVEPNKSICSSVFFGNEYGSS
jgi:hypothetical protein